MTLEQTIRDIGGKFGLTPEDLNLISARSAS